MQSGATSSCRGRRRGRGRGALSVGPSRTGSDIAQYESEPNISHQTPETARRNPRAADPLASYMESCNEPQPLPAT